MLADVPVALILVGLIAYMVLAGADFGTGLWELTAGRDPFGAALRDRAHDAMGPVWEANHVWLIFVLAVFWSAYPTAFASVFSTLAIPLFVAILGIILRGSAYALRAVARGGRERGLIERIFALSSIATPFALGATIGGIASGRVPLGNAAGNLITSWLNPTSIMIGVIAVAAAGHLAAVYLAADARRGREPRLVEAFRARALLSGVVTGALALIGLAVVHADAPPLFSGLAHGAGLGAVAVSGAAGVVTLILVSSGRYEPARYAGALAVAAIIAGWAAAQRPEILPGLSIQAAAAGRSTLLTVLVVIGIGGLVIVPSLILLFRLFLKGTFDPSAVRETTLPRREGGPMPPSLAVSLFGLFVVGAVLTVFADAGWAQSLGVAALLIFVAGGFIMFATSIASKTPGDSSVGPDPTVPTRHRR